MTATSLKDYCNKTYSYLVSNPVGITPLISFRIAFGILMLSSTLRFWYMGWIEQLYLSPKFYFKYYGFYWIPEPSEFAIYCIFTLLIISSIFITLGLFYRISTLLFFLLFTYTELIDASNYLNHYYFISIVAFLLIFIPANNYFALDNYLFKNEKTKVAAWTINILKLQLGIVYFYAGIAKLNSDWLFEALPLKMWLPSKIHLPIIGSFLQFNTTAYLFSWGGAIFDLSIFFLLIFSKTRPYAYAMVIFFHLITWYLFPIGMFPFVMIASTLIFFSEKNHTKLYTFIKGKTTQSTDSSSVKKLQPALFLLLGIFVLFQLCFPFRYLAYPDNLFWTEQGYRFSWRVMLLEKGGYASFKVVSADGQAEIIDNTSYLTPFQEKMMSTQVDFMLQYAAHLKQVYTSKGLLTPKIYADVFVSLNGRGSKRFIDPSVNLAALKDNFKNKTYILPYE